MAQIDPIAARQFAEDVVRRLRSAGYEALFAGGCVRDALLGNRPKDYDVATSARPEQIQQVFGQRRTLAIGASFGVITVVGPRTAGQIDVVTFRHDVGYSDGRRPDAVEFTTAEQDALRRDFTINGLFYDPLRDEVIDYVGGQEDLKARIIRAIGNPSERIAEDKLRMLRAVRFAARYDFALDPATLAAIQQQAGEIVVVSAERIAAEMRLILTHESRARGAHLLQTTGLLSVLLPEVAAQSAAGWPERLKILQLLERPTFAVALAALIRETAPADLPQRLFERWRLASDELEGVAWCLAEEALIRAARKSPWPRLQRVLVAPRADELLDYCQAVARVLDGDAAEIEFCRAKLALPGEILNPEPLLSGNDLKQLGIPPGPAYRPLLEAVRDAQLSGQIARREEALALAQSLHAAPDRTC